MARSARLVTELRKRGVFVFAQRGQVPPAIWLRPLTLCSLHPARLKALDEPSATLRRAVLFFQLINARHQNPGDCAEVEEIGRFEAWGEIDTARSRLMAAAHIDTFYVGTTAIGRQRPGLSADRMTSIHTEPSCSPGSKLYAGNQNRRVIADSNADMLNDTRPLWTPRLFYEQFLRVCRARSARLPAVPGSCRSGLDRPHKTKVSSIAPDQRRSDERFHKTILQEFYGQVTMSERRSTRPSSNCRMIWTEWIDHYNNERTQ